jgi:hypothetical protein
MKVGHIVTVSLFLHVLDFRILLPGSCVFMTFIVIIIPASITIWLNINYIKLDISNSV